MTRILCTGDLHLGAGTDFGRTLRGDGSRLADQADLWLRICKLAVSEGCDALLFAGDAFHRPKPTPAELLAFRAGLDELNAHGLEVLAIPGNHDVSSADEPTVLSIFGDPMNVRQGDLLQLATVPMVKAASAWPLEGISVAMLPWAPAGRLVAAAAGGDRDALHRDLADRLVEVARGLRAECDPNEPAVLMLHWSISGAVNSNGEDVSLFREPVLPYADLEAMGWSAIVAGHIHRAQVLGSDILRFYVGSPGIVNFGEAEYDHGVRILTYDAFGWSTEVRAIKGRPFVTWTVMPEGPYVLPEQRLDGAVVRVRYAATPEEKRQVDEGAIRRALLDAGAHKVYSIEANVTREGRARAEHVHAEIDPLAALDAYVEARQIPDERAQPMRERTAVYLEAEPVP